MITFFITLILVIQIIPILYYTYASAISKNSNSMYLAVVIPPEAVNDPEVQAIFQSYRKEIRKISLICLILSLIGCFLLLTPVFSDYIMTFLIIVFISTFLPIYYLNQAVFKHRRRLLEKKASSNWKSSDEKIVYADLMTSRLKNLRTPKSWLFVIPALISLSAYLFLAKNTGMLILLISNLIMHFLFWFAHRTVSHMPAKIYTDDSPTNLMLNQEYRRNWSLAYLGMSLIQSLLTIFLGAFHLQFIKDPSALASGYFLGILLLMSMIPIAVILLVAHRQKQRERQFLQNRKKLITPDEDMYYEEYPIWGLMYNNPDNPSVLINKPFGIGQIVNIGTGKGRLYFLLGKWILASVLVFALGIVYFEETISPAIQITPQEITVYQTLYPIQIPVENIESIEYHAEAFHRQDIYKNVGTATNRYLRGTFSGKGDPSIRMYFFQNMPYLLFHLKNREDSKLYFNYKKPADTEALYRKISQILPDKVISEKKEAPSDSSADKKSATNPQEKTAISTDQRKSFTAAEIDYTIPAGNGSLHAVLNLPESSRGKVPAVLIIGGSGPSTKEGMANLYLDLAINLTKKGIAVIRYDKRGIAGSASVVDAKTEEINMVLEDFVGDVISLLQKAEMDDRFSAVYIAGHSEGALVGTLAAQTVPIDGIISLAGAGRNIAEITLEQIKANPNNPPKLIEDSQRIIDSLRAGRTTDDVSPLLMALFRPSVQPYLISWMAYDPAVELAKLNGIPILILQGDNDSQVQVVDAENLHQASKNSQLIIIPEMTHMLKLSTIRKEEAFQKADSAIKYAKIYQDDKIPIDPRVSEAILSFIFGK